MEQLFITADGSHSVSDSNLNTSYHSKFGAISESQHIYIEGGLRRLLNKEAISMFEMGFGTGLNALLTMINALAHNVSVYYETADTRPLHPDLYTQLNYCEQLGRPALQDAFLQMHMCEWNNPALIDNNFILCKKFETIETVQLSRLFDLVYWDAFDPLTQPELWSSTIFTQIRKHMHAGALLLTYSSKTSVQRALRDAGFQVEKFAGPQGKRDVIRATAL